MTREETVQLLKLVVAGDRRTIGPDDVAYWHVMLAPIAFVKAVEALVMIRRRDPDRWIDPGHLWQMCSTRTDGQQTDTDTDCDHGTLCSRCKLVHWPGELCSALVPRALTSKLAALAQPVPAAGPDPHEPEITDPAAVEAERARQLAALAPLVNAEQDTPTTQGALA